MNRPCQKPCYYAALLALGVSIATPVFGQDPVSNRLENLAQVTKIHHAWQQAHGKDSNFMLRPGLLADRTKRQIQFQAEATGLSGSTPIEFWLIATNSGHDYEAAAVAFVQPSDLHAALEFIGVAPGHPVSDRKRQYWPRGERVLMFFEWEYLGAPQRARAEDLFIHTDGNRPLPSKGLVFTGSYTTSADGPLAKRYAADVFEPNSIAANFNEPGTVLDVPRQASQATVYGKQIANPQYVMAKGQRIQVTLVPAYPPSQKRVAPLELTARSPADTNAPPGAVQFMLAAEGGRPITNTTDRIGLLAALGHITASGQDPFVTLRFDEGLPLAKVRETCRFLDPLDREDGLHIEAPPEGQPFFRIFLPNEEWRVRGKRNYQPWELHLNPGGLKGLGILTQLEESWDDQAEKSNLKVKEHPVANTRELCAFFRDTPDASRVVFVFAPAALLYGEMRALAQAIMREPTITYLHVFLEE